MFYGCCRRVSRFLGMVLEPISKSTVHELARKVSTIRISRVPRYRRYIVVDEAKLSIKRSTYAYGPP